MIRREPEPDAAARQRVHREELVERRRQGGHVADFAAGDDARREGLAGQLTQMRRAVVHDARGRQLRGADLDADELAAPRALPEATRPDALRATRRLCDEAFDFLFEVDHWLHLHLGKDTESGAGRACGLAEREVGALE